jgi:glycine/D-amino acid oxidase-like deaminating enzyme
MRFEAGHIGAGIAELCMAWELIEAGRSVAVLEADRVAAGVTGYTTAKLSSLHTLIYARIRKSFRGEAAQHYAQSQQQALQRVAAVAARLGIDCDLEDVAGFTYVESQEQLDQVRAEVAAATEAVLSASFVTETGLPFRSRARSGLRTKHSSTRASTLALAEDISRRSGRIFERTRAVELDESEPCRVTIESGATVMARDVVIATQG